MGRKDLVMRKQRSFSIEFKRQVVEEYLSGAGTAAQLCRKHSISSGLLYHWRRQYLKNSFEADSAREVAQEERIRLLEQALEKAHLEVEFFIKSSASELRTVPEKRKFITDNRNFIETLTRGCELMNLPRSSYYYKPKLREISPEDQALISRIEGLAEDFATYGYRKITAQLRRYGIVVNRKKVQRIMREKGLFAKKTRRFVKTTDSNHPYPVYPNLLKGLKVTGVNQAWVADITYSAPSQRYLPVWG